MKKLKIFFGLLAFSAGLLTVSLPKEETEVKAAGVPIAAGTKLYLELGPWKVDSPKFAVWLFGGSGADQWVYMTEVQNDDDFYELTMPAGNYTKVIFFRQNPSTSGAWEGQWGKTGNLEFEENKNMYTITGWGENDGNWSTYVPRNIATVTFNVTVPTNTPDGDIYIVGDFEGRIPSWDPGNEQGKLTKIDDFLYQKQFVFRFFESFEIKYKFTRGSWDNEEVTPEGWGIEDRTLPISVENLSPEANDVVARWKDLDLVEPELPPLPEFTPTVEGINSGKVRIWLDRGEYDMGYTVTLKINDVYYLPTDSIAAIHEGRWFVYYDMPLSVFTGGPQVDLVVYITDVKEVNVISAGAYTAGYNNKIWKINGSGDNATLAKGAITDRILPKFFAKVLEGYLTCSESVENGYKAFPAIDEFFLPRVVEDGKEVWNMGGNLDGNMITDYSGEGTSGYASNRGTGVEVDAYDKYMALKNMYYNGKVEGNKNPGSVSIPQNQNVNATLVIAILGLVTLGGYYFLSRKKKVV